MSGYAYPDTMQERTIIQTITALGLGTFTIQDAAKILKKEGPGLNILLNRLTKRKVISRIERGKYRLVDIPDEVVSTGIIIPSYISFLWALSYHKLSNQMPSNKTIVTLRKHAPLKIGNSNFHFMVIQKKRFFGMERHKIRNAWEFTVAEPEKALIDSLCYPAYCPVSEVIDSVQTGAEEELLVPERIVDYTLRMGSQAGAKRLGYLLDLVGINLYDRLRSLVGGRYDPLDPSLPAKGKYDARWHIIVNTEA